MNKFRPTPHGTPFDTLPNTLLFKPNACGDATKINRRFSLDIALYGHVKTTLNVFCHCSLVSVHVVNKKRKPQNARAIKMKRA